jgi:hypothetical protein
MDQRSDFNEHISNLEGGIFAPPGLLRALGEWSEVLRGVWQYPPIMAQAPSMPPHVLEGILMNAPNGKQHFSLLGRKELSFIDINIHSGFSYETCRRMGRPALHRDLQPMLQKPRPSTEYVFPVCPVQCQV